MRLATVILFLTLSHCTLSHAESLAPSTYQLIGVWEMDSIPVSEADSTAEINRPRKALMLSAVLPGLGQAYNQKYWKMPIVYGGFIGFGFVINYYNNIHARFKNELILSIQDSQYLPPSGATKEQLRSIVDRSQRERDYMTILTGIFYLLQIADAHIDAHLREFELNPDFMVRIEPVFDNSNGISTSGIGIKLRF